MPVMDQVLVQAVVVVQEAGVLIPLDQDQDLVPDRDRVPTAAAMTLPTLVTSL